MNKYQIDGYRVNINVVKREDKNSKRESDKSMSGKDKG